MSDSISRDQAINRINKQREHLQPDVYPQDAIGDAAYRICAEIIERLPSAEPQWIPCEERLPEENGNYLVTATWNGKREVDIDYFQFMCQWDDYRNTVVAWMPLPKPYEGGTE